MGFCTPPHPESPGWLTRVLVAAGGGEGGEISAISPGGAGGDGGLLGEAGGAGHSADSGGGGGTSLTAICTPGAGTSQGVGGSQGLLTGVGGAGGQGTVAVAPSGGGGGGGYIGGCGAGVATASSRPRVAAVGAPASPTTHNLSTTTPAFRRSAVTPATPLRAARRGSRSAMTMPTSPSLIPPHRRPASRSAQHLISRAMPNTGWISPPAWTSLCTPTRATRSCKTWTG